MLVMMNIKIDRLQPPRLASLLVSLARLQTKTQAATGLTFDIKRVMARRELYT